MTKNERLKIARQNSGLSQEELASKLGVNQTYIANLEKDKGFSLKKAREIGLILGIDGEELFTGNKKVITSTPIITHKGNGVPYYDVDFIGGFNLIFDQQSARPSAFIDFAPFNDCDFWVNVTGKSMDPLISDNDIVALKILPDWQEFLLEGEIYAIVTSNDIRTIKTIGKGEDKDHYTLIPYNKAPEYNPQPIPKRMLTHVFRVKGSIKKFF
jgi:transcriptional regulator with XRE-family HTH domain